MTAVAYGGLIMKIHQLKIDFNVTERVKRFVYVLIPTLTRSAAEGFMTTISQRSSRSSKATAASTFYARKRSVH